MTELEALAPEDAIQRYLRHRKNQGTAEATQQSHRYRLKAFHTWCREREIENINVLGGRHIHDYQTWRAEGNGPYDAVKPVTLQGQMSTVKKFLEFCESIDAVEPGVSQKASTMMPTLDRGEESSDDELPADTAYEILSWLTRFDYASRDHVMFELMWHVGLRLGGVRAIDLDDIDYEWRQTDEGHQVVDGAYIELHHRPESDTPLKNRYDGERDVVVADHPARVLHSYQQNRRTDVKDEYGRHPFITTSNGRISKGTIRQRMYRLTRPCMWKDCPHDRDVDSCEATEYNKASKCPSSVSTHPIRRGSITHQLLEGVEIKTVSDRVNSDLETIQKHYDQRTKRQRAYQRQQEIQEKL